jgi:transposase
MTKPPLEADTFRRIEVITGVGRRRWSEEQKAAIVAETLEPGAAVSEVAQRHGVSASQVFSWRKAARKQAAVPAAYPAFVPAAIEPGPSTPVRMGYALIEVEIEGAKIRIPPDAAPETVLAVLEGLSVLPKRRR